MLYKSVIALTIAGAAAQKVGSLKEESHPQLEFSTCKHTFRGSTCTPSTKKVVVDSNWRWIHQTGEAKNCYDGNEWDATLCPDVATCAANCALEGADVEYADTYGIRAQGDALDLQFVTKGPYSTNVGSRTYLMDDDETYYMFKLKNREFTFDVDVSALPCGLNGALYFVQMEADGGKQQYAGNKAGAKYGTGYCDAQCPKDLKFINGEPNMLNWQPSASDPNAGTGKYGSCCVEMDIWEANSISTAYTAHSCDVKEQTRCGSAKECGDNPDHRFDGVCDKNGCDFQTYRLGNESFYGPGGHFELDSTQKMTVVTQFVTVDGTDHGAIKEIRRFYRQGGRTIETPTIHVPGARSFDALSGGYCQAEAAYMDDGTNFLGKGGFGSMGDAFDKGMVLVMSIWDDHDVNMLWLDSTYPVSGGKGSARGTCSTDSGVPKQVESEHGDSHVTFSNIRFGPIGSTTAANVTATLVEGAERLAAATASRAAPWARCTTDAGCIGGWECTQHATDVSFRQCTPTTALHEAFLKTKPDAAAIAAFMREGTTHFAASGLPH